VAKLEDCTSATITTRRVLFQPETERVVVGQQKMPDGSVKQKFVQAISLLKDVVFEETHDNSMNAEPEGSETEGNGSGSGNGSSQNSENSGNSGNSGQSQQGGDSQNQSTGFALTISKTGTGSASVTINGNSVSSGSSLSEDDEVAISITPAEGQVPTATINGSEIELTEDGGVYTGSFAMPGQASTLIINTGEGEDDDYDPNA
jgi:hypothetical protein